MHRGDVLEGVGHLSDAIIACGVLPLLGGLCKDGWGSRPTPAAILACYASFAADAVYFGAPERLVLRELDIRKIIDVEWWTRVVLAVSQPEGCPALIRELCELREKLNFAADSLPNLVPSPPPLVVGPGLALVEVVLPSQDHTPSHPLRLSCAIESLCTLWGVICDLDGHFAPLNVVACLSSPEIAVTFRGPAARVAELKALLMQVWDQIVVNHRATLEERIANIPSLLPIMDRIGAGTEMADGLRRDVETGVKLFLQAGAYIPEMHDPERFTPARLLQVSTCIPTGRATRPAQNDSPDEESEDGIEAIVAEERAHLRQSLFEEQAWIRKIRFG